MSYTYQKFLVKKAYTKVIQIQLFDIVAFYVIYYYKLL